MDFREDYRACPYCLDVIQKALFKRHPKYDKDKKKLINSRLEHGIYT